MTEPRTTADEHHAQKEGASYLSVPEAFEAIVQSLPQQTAVTFRGAAVTYDELNRMANRLAHAILSAKPSGSNVILMFEPGIASMAGFLGTLKAGKTCVPVEPDHPIDRIQRIWDNAEASLVIATNATLRQASDFIAGMADQTTPLLNVEALDPALPDSNPGLDIAPESYAYLVYTSGSTGAPKGVLSTHMRITFGAERKRGLMSLTLDDHMALLIAHSLSFANSQIYAALLNGVTLCIYDVKREGIGGMVEWMAREKITCATMVPTLFRQLAQQLDDQTTLPNLRMIRLSGEAAARSDVELFRRKFPQDVDFYNTLGASEVGLISNFLITPEILIDDAVVPLGYAVPGIEILILDEAGRILPPNTRGEIAIKSTPDVPGYWRDPGLTARKYIHLPENGDRVYLTGDMGMLQPDGCLIFFGREDFQVKIRGHRVELTEVEAVLLEAPEVKDAALVVVQDERGQNRLAAYIVPERWPGPTAQDIRAWLTLTLPDYAIPSHVVPLEALPRSAGGKVDRTALPVPEFNRRSETLPYIAPRNTLERQLAAIWQEVLGIIEPIGVQDSFLDLGGDSLSALQVFAQIEVELGKRLPLDVMARASTIEQLAQEIKQEDTPPPWPSLVPLQPEGSRPPLFCIHGLGGNIFAFHLFARSLHPDQPVYALRSQGLDGVTPPFLSVNRIVQHYIREIRTVQPEGPYYLLGFSFGGILAFEMARQFERDGQQVALVAAVDTVVTERLDGVQININASTVPQASAVQMRVGEHMQKLQTLSWLDKAKYLLSLARRLWYYQVVQRASTKLGIIDPMGKPHWTVEQRIKWANDVAGSSYQFHPYSGRITLFITEQMRTLWHDPIPFWTQWARGGIHVVELPGGHNSMFREPDVVPFTQKLRETLHLTLG